MRLTIPNQLTLLRIILTPVFIVLFLRGSAYDQLYASIAFFLAAVTDWYDGWFARTFGVITRWGQFMDPLADKFLVSSALIIFAVMGYVKWWMVWIILSRDVMVTIIRIYAIGKGTPIVTHNVAKLKTFFQMNTVFIILLYVNWLNFHGTGSSTYHSRYFDGIGILMILVTLLTLISAVIYVVENSELILRFLRVIFIFPFRLKK
ncbi:MAG TPA: CDP-diacylglycerol--glycerol-3-phosphate 3-phosphatidyltransferase [Caldithrix sp.]|nr:CDP-diacylglycerol--glycerol-3-phosphate 3-phosphatidyltransferase [Caldithrix sp.]